MVRSECPQWKYEVGVYLLGALTPGERDQFEQHLATCVICRDDVVHLAGLPGLLARVTEAQVVGHTRAGETASDPGVADDDEE